MEQPQTRTNDTSTRGRRRVPAAGMIIRQKEPLNLEMPFDQVDSYLTPVDSFYIRNHFPEPKLEAVSYELRIGGAVRRPLTLSYDELRAMPAEKRVAVLECAGNSRVFLVPQADGAQWELGAVGNAEWTGVPLRLLLERAGIDGDACEVVLEGADRGMAKEKPIPPGPIAYSRSISRKKALARDVLVAYQMNGEDLPPDHGYPVRAIVPGHYGMASVKWLTGIDAVREPFQGYWQTSDYAYWDYLDAKPVRRPLGEVALKSAISRPGVREVVRAGELYTVHGAAWTGESEIAKIDVSVDGGETWACGEFIDSAQRYSWRRWTFDWQTPETPGSYTLMARATDAQGATQPDKHDQNFGSYVIHHALPIEVFVR